MLDEVKHLRDETLEIGKEIGKYEGIVKVNHWLIELMTLVRGENNLEAERVRIILLSVLHGSLSWMKHSQAKGRFGIPTYTTQKLIEELEKWQTEQPKSLT